MNTPYYTSFSIKRNAHAPELFQVFYDGETIVYRDERDELVVDERTVCNTFSAAQDYIHDVVTEMLTCDAEREQERYIAMNFDECGNRFRDGDEW